MAKAPSDRILAESPDMPEDLGGDHEPDAPERSQGVGTP